MKQSKILFILMAALALLFAAGCSNDPVQIAPPPAGNTSAPATPAQQVAGNLTIIDITHEYTEMHPRAMSMDVAAQVAAQYILDVFGENISGMFVELEFTNWSHMTRTLWHGAVSVSGRNTLEHRARNMELNEVTTARIEAGEDWDDIMADMADMFPTYIPARFYFYIDGVTGERVDIWITLPEHIQTMNESIPLHEYIEQEWGGDWTTAFDVDLSPPEIDALNPIVLAYAQRHFNDSTITGMEFESAFMAFIYSGGGFDRDPSAVFVGTSDAGRVARVTIHIASRTVTSINTMSNDFIPMDFDHMEGERTRHIEESNN